MKLSVVSVSFDWKILLCVVALWMDDVEARNFLTSDSTLTRSSHDSTPATIKPMGLFDLNLGMNVRHARVTDNNFPDSRFTDNALGFSGRVQSSILWSYKSIAGPKKFTWGDILAAEVFAGQLSSNLSHQTGPLWLAYKFEFGLGGRIRINDNNDVGLNLILLEFSKDNVSGNVSGSGLRGRYRYKRAMIEAGVLARQERVLGVLVDIQKKIPLQLSFTGRYLLKSGRNVGVNLEILPATFPQDNYNYSKTWSLKIFYGIYF